MVSNFTRANSCEENQCQMPNETFTRRVIVPPRHRGEHCPELSRMTPCPKCFESYTFKFSDWAPCSPMPNHGALSVDPLIGQQTRQAVCLKSKGVVARFR